MGSDVTRRAVGQGLLASWGVSPEELAARDPALARAATAPRKVKLIGARIHPTEWQEQTAVVMWWGRQAPLWGHSPFLLLAIPNGTFLAGDSRRRAIQIQHLKSSGMRIGAPDMLLAIPTPREGGLFIELKAMDGVVSQVQDDMHAILRRHYRVVVCKGADAAIKTITEYLGKG